MAKDLRLDVVTSSDGKGLLSAAAEVDHLADKTDKLGHKFDETAVQGAFLARELEVVKLKSAELARQFNETGDKAILRQISRNQSYERQLQRVGKELESFAGDAEKLGFQAGKQIGDGISSGIGDASQAAGPQAGPAIIGGIVAAAVAAAPVAGAMIGGALLAGIGTVGIGAGIAAEMHDPRIQAAAVDLKHTIGDELKAAAAPFIGPTVDALHQLKADFTSDIAPGLSHMFKELAPEVRILEKGVAGFVKGAADGFEKAAIAAKPLLDDLGHTELPQLGKTIGDLFRTVAAHSSEAQTGLKLLFTAVDVGIHVIDFGIIVFSDLFDIINKTAVALTEFVLPATGASQVLQQFFNNADHTGTSMADAGIAVVHLGDKLNDTTAATQALIDAWNVLDGTLSEDQAISHGKDLIAGIAGQLDKYNKSIDQNTKTGRSNREAIVGDIQDQRSHLAGLVSQGKITQAQADKMFASWLKGFEKSAEKAGVTTSAIEDLNKQLGLLPNSIPIHIKMTYTSSGMAHPAPTHAKHHAKGGPFAPGELMLVGEEGPELLQFDRGGSVIPNHALSSAMPGSGSGGGGGAQTFVIEFAPSGDPLIDAIMAAMRPRIRNQYRGNVTAALAGAR